MNVLIIGAGAVGCFYGALLARAGASVTLCARSDYATLKTHGVAITSINTQWHFTPAAVVRDPAELAQKPDYVLVCVKVTAGVDRVALLRPAVGPNTAIVLLSNGINIEAEIAAAYPDNDLISGLAFICVTRTAAGKIWHQAYGRLALGNYPAGLSAATHALCKAFERAGIICAANDNITTARWQKCVWNAPFNPLSVLSGGLATADILATQEPLVRQLMLEITQIAAAAGHPLPDNIIELNISSTHKMPPYKTSMLLDFAAGRPMETEAILGNAVRCGQALGVAIPHLETLYGLMKLREFSSKPH